MSRVQQLIDAYRVRRVERKIKRTLRLAGWIWAIVERIRRYLA